jgi:hypothetical protein
MSVIAPTESSGEPRDGVIEQARQRRRRRLAHRSLAGALLLGIGALMLVALFGGGTSSSLTLAFGAEAPAPLSRTVPGTALRVALAPNLEPGRPGWCVVTREARYEGGGCEWLPTSAHPFVGDGWSTPPGASEATSVLLTTPQVSSLGFNGHRLRTLAAPGVPFGLRVAVLRRPAARLPEIRPTVIALGGRSFTEGAAHPPELPVRYWNWPQAPPRGGACSLSAAPLSGLSARWGGVVTALRGFPGQLAGRGLLPCIETGYHLEGRQLEAILLLDAAAPGTRSPAPIPGFAPIAQDPAFFNSSIDCCQGPFTAERVGKAWLLVAGGIGAEQQRVRLLRDLSASVDTASAR